MLKELSGIFSGPNTQPAYKDQLQDKVCSPFLPKLKAEEEKLSVPEHRKYLRVCSKVSRESDLRSVPYNRPVGVRS